MTHAELVDRAARWLRNSQRCKPVFTESSIITGGESPDAIGWDAHGNSILIECKASVSDFYNDSSKPFRADPALGMGDLRYYLVPKGLIEPERVQRVRPGWGLLYCLTKTIRVVHHSGRFEIQNKHAEIRHLRARWIWPGPSVSQSTEEVE